MGKMAVKGLISPYIREGLITSPAQKSRNVIRLGLDHTDGLLNKRHRKLAPGSLECSS